MAWVQARAIELYRISSRVQNSMILNIPYRSVQQMAKVKTLVDSGATENLVDKETAKELRMTLQELPSARNITNVDGTGNANGPITHFCKLRIHQNKEGDVQKFYVTNLGNN
jgi:gag-polyprotein putative aspartyl protease